MALRLVQPSFSGVCQSFHSLAECQESGDTLFISLPVAPAQAGA